MPQKKKTVKLSSKKVHQSLSQKDGVFTATSISQFNRPEGKRMFGGEGKSRNANVAQSKADFSATFKASFTPSDSLSTKKVKSFLKKRRKK